MSAVRSENKESSCSPVDGVLQAVLEGRRGQSCSSGEAGRERGKEVLARWAPAQREGHIWGDAAIIHAQVGVVKKSIRLHFYDR